MKGSCMSERYLLLAPPESAALREALAPHVLCNEAGIEGLPQFEVVRVHREDAAGEIGSFRALDYVIERVLLAFEIELHPGREEYFRSLDHTKSMKERQFRQLEGMEDYLRDELKRQENARRRLHRADDYLPEDVRVRNQRRRVQKLSHLSDIQTWVAREKRSAERDFEALAAYHTGLKRSGRNAQMFRICVRLVGVYRQIFELRPHEPSIRSRGTGAGTVGGFVRDVLNSMRMEADEAGPSVNRDRIDRVRAPDAKDLFKHYLLPADKIWTNKEFRLFRDLDD